MTRPIRRVALLGLLLLLVGCPTPDETDDDTIVDDDTDDTDEGWTSILTMPDARGDAGSYLADIKDYQYKWDGQTLQLRVTSHIPFDEAEPGFGVDMCIDDHSGNRTCLSYDHSYDPEPLVLWDMYSGFVPTQSPSLFFDDDGPSSIVLGIDLAEVGLEHECRFSGTAGLSFSSGYNDLAPDETTSDFEISDVPVMDLSAVTFDGSDGGDGDGQLDPGETVGLSIELSNRGCGPSGGQLSAQASLEAFGAADATLTVDSTAVANGAWTLPLTRQVVSYPAAISKTQLLSDPDGEGTTFDIARVDYRVTGS